MEKLNTELCRLVFGNLGAYDNISLFQNSCSKIKIKEDEKEKSFDVFSGINSEGDEIVATNLDSDLYVVIKSKTNIVGIYLDNEQNGNFLYWLNDNWIPLTLQHKLALCLAIESYVQDGIMWEKCLLDKDLESKLNLLIEFDKD